MPSSGRLRSHARSDSSATRPLQLQRLFHRNGPTAPEDPLDATLTTEAGQLIIAGFDGHTLPADIRDALAEGRVGGTILFARNIKSPKQVAALNSDIYAACGDHPLPFISVDQEGGRVQRIREPLTRFPAMFEVGAAADSDLSAALGEALGDELMALGFNLDFAPCIDIFTNSENKVIGDRAFGRGPGMVSRFAGAFSAGLTISGIIPCAKHFPGHGDTRLDSHFDLPVVEHDMKRLREIELRPFEAFIRTGVPMIMTAHLLVPAIDPDHPVTLSEAGIAQLLRVEMGYGGVVITDDLEMAAVAERYEIEELVERSLRAGVDIQLICHTADKWQRAYEHLIKLGAADARDRERIRQAASRVAHLKEHWLRPWEATEPLVSADTLRKHAALVQRVADSVGSA